ncbi:MAG: hypothetical protein P8J32_00830 [bacterium]|nr:hypothetical protein [bacterium]
MKKVIAKLTKAELNQMIAEEYANLKTVAALKQKKEAIQKEIKQLKESYGLDEVEVSGHKDKGDAYFMKGLPVQKFEKKGTHLKEMDLDVEEEDCGEVESMLRDLGRKLDALLDGQDELEADHEELGADSAGDAEELDADGMEDMEEMEKCDSKYEEGEDSLSEEDIVSEEKSDEDVETVSEEEGDCDESEETIDEQDGETVANAAPQDTVNDNMDKVDNKNAEADKLYEGAQPAAPRLNPQNNPLINEELERMKKLANLL